MDKVFITAAVTGSGPTRKNSPHIPYTPEEIAAEIVRSFEAGAAITHVHVRDPKTGAPSFELEYFREIRDRVRATGEYVTGLRKTSLGQLASVWRDDVYFALDRHRRLKYLRGN